MELEYPVNGQYPEQMYSFIKDIAFMEQLNISNKGRVTGLFVCGVIKMTDNSFYHLVNLSH